MDLRTKLIHAQKFADQVLRENFDLEQRVRILTDKLGFRSVQEAEESQSQPPLEVLLQEKLDSARKHIASLQKAAIESYEEHHSEVEILRKRINELENERLLSKEAGSLSMHRDINSSSDVDALKSEYEERIEEKNIVIAELKNRLSSQVPNLGSGTREKQLSSPIPDEMSPLIISSQNTADTAESLARLEARHAELERKYDLLRDEKRAISRKFSDHLKKWKNFKLWWLKEYEADKRDAENGANDPPNTNYIKRQRKIIAMQQALDSEGNDGPTALNKLLSSATEALKGHGEDAEGLAGRAPSEGSSSTRSGGIVPPKPSSPGVSLSSIEAGMQRVSNSGEGTDGAAALDSLLIEKNPPTICSGLPSAKSHTLETKLDNDALSAMPALDLHRSGSTPVPVFYPQGEMPTVVDMLHSRSPLLESVPVTPSGSHSKSSTIAEASLKSSPAQRVSTKMTSQRRGERNTGVEPRSRLSTSVHNPKRIPQEFIDDAETEPESKPHDGPRMPPRIHDTPGPRLQRQHSSPATTPRRHSKKPWLPNSAKLDTTYNNEEGVVVEDDAVPVPTSSLHRKSHSSASVLERRSSEPTSMTKEEREQYFKSLKGKTHEEYKREYAQFKGRGRYAHQPAR
ncbi:uncharacterized protein EI90DRAFT_2987262 [Cantharellus anzutake]|uniref:uncharacterized protein n=1 Tax=Cantharellus anzutake TaxID=1750568 RepID=UPI0019048A61|nr:uncharacterized protein EI90DRAFT_2987262 [Cantharellus anzutake]KAF8343959.1 hypothetical protein EI90DRAFT_2987262 [Cantharellus anzutake]